MYSYKVTVSHGQISRVDVWKEAGNKTYCIFSIEKETESKFITAINLHGQGRSILTVDTSVSSVVCIMPDLVATKIKQAFEFGQPTLGDILKIFPGAVIKYQN
jgi:hypothetical protein